MTRKKFANDEAHGSISFDSRRVWKQVRARSNATFPSASFPCVNAHAWGEKQEVRHTTDSSVIIHCLRFHNAILTIYDS